MISSGKPSIRRKLIRWRRAYRRSFTHSNLSVTLNIEFYDAWNRDNTAPLANILANASRLQSLTFQASNSPYDTPWNRLNVQDDSLRGISLGLESLPSEALPIFDRLTHLELQTISTCNLEILLSRAPNLSSLAITLPDGLSEAEITSLLSSLRHVPNLKQLAVSIADWEPCPGSTEATLVKEVLRAIAQRLPSLEVLDLRTKSYDMVDGILAYACIQLDWLSFEVCGMKLSYMEFSRLLISLLTMNRTLPRSFLFSQISASCASHFKARNATPPLRARPSPSVFPSLNPSPGCIRKLSTT